MAPARRAQPARSWISKGAGAVAAALAAVNIFGGFLVTQRMLAMYKKKAPARRRSGAAVNANLAAILYLVSGVLFILALRGLSSPETSRRGNRYGMIGMAIAVGDDAGHPVGPGPLDPLTLGLIVGGVAIGGDGRRGDRPARGR